MSFFLICLIFLINIINLTLIVAFLYPNLNVFRPINVKNNATEEDEFSLDVEETELDVIQRQFDARIASMKEELALRQSVGNGRSGVIAPELHPKVYNLPHDSVNTYSPPFKGEEYAK